MLAQISDLGWLALFPLSLYFVIWCILGAVLLRIGGWLVVPSPGPGYPKCLAAVALGTFAALVALTLTYWFSDMIGPSTPPPWARATGYALAFLVFAAIVKWWLRTSFTDAAVASLPVAAGAALLWIMIAHPEKLRGSLDDDPQVRICQNHLRAIGGALGRYAADNAGQFPPDLETLVRTGHLSDRGDLRCITVDGRPNGEYPYAAPLGTSPPASRAARGPRSDLLTSTHEVILVADLKGCHRGNRNVLYTGGWVCLLPEQAFQNQLEKPWNAAFAAALRAADVDGRGNGSVGLPGSAPRR